jgi:hypothetical protein
MQLAMVPAHQRVLAAAGTALLRPTPHATALRVVCSCRAAAVGQQPSGVSGVSPLPAGVAGAPPGADSPYIFKASAAPLVQEKPGLKIKEAHMLDGMALRLQARPPPAPHTRHSTHMRSQFSCILRISVGMVAAAPEPPAAAAGA